MKKIFTFIFSLGLITAVSAQSRGNHQDFTQTDRQHYGNSQGYHSNPTPVYQPKDQVKFDRDRRDQNNWKDRGYRNDSKGWRDSKKSYTKGFDRRTRDCSFQEKKPGIHLVFSFGGKR